MVSLDGLEYSSHKMNWDFSQTEDRDGVLVYAPPLPRLLPLHAAAFSTPYHSIHSYQKDSSPSPPTPSSASKISPAILFIIIVLAVVFFISGLLHLLVRFLMKRPSSSSSSQPNRYPEVRGSDAIQRQLQQLFHLHDSGLDQAFIDSLPVFLYKEIMGLKEPFDCAVCLCEFSEEDKLRLLPLCGHAFHIDCIDTWLLSNSTCPLCRGALYGSGLGIENPIFEFDYAREEDGFSGDEEVGISGGQKPTAEETGGVQKRVFSVRLGKFKSSNANEGGGETSTSNLDGRRCYSMGSYQYVVGDSELQVALCGQKDGDDNGDRDGGKQQQMKRRGGDGNCSIEMDVEGKKLCKQSKGESFSVSKIWLWPKKGKCTGSSDVNAHGDEIPTVGSTLSSSFPAALQALQKQIGYQFQTVDLLRRAMTHPSYSRDNNKLLSYLGLRTIQSTASLRLISRDPEMSPKDLDRRITEIGREDACAVGATRLGLEKVVRVSAKTDVSAPVVLCGAFRAIFGAVAVDNGTVDAGGDVFWRVRGSGAGGVFLYDL